METKELILEKSAELFNSRGYDGCSMNNIMEATGLQKGGIYNHFSNKEEIAVAAFDFAMTKVIARFRERLDKDSTSWAKLESIIRTIGSFAYDPVIVGGCPMFNTAVNSMNSHPSLKKRAQEGLNMLRRYVEIKIEEGVASGEFKDVENIEGLASMIISTVEGGVIMSRVYDQDEFVLRAEEFMLGHLKRQLKENN